MYMDTVVLAGLATIGLIFGFFIWLYLLIKKDIKAHPGEKH